ncbi:hypothetical protein PN417_00455 [Halorubrum ezzemoulense]|uniref:hypothetical protein n=1 Tax=Halorubrum ezzemoulense TaxID=337243 RepID=UPI00232E4EED|nr:hypothetical protein [Halorubrum ezzemoulense]MDB9299420.1 hypothetical protein [Halorubrum ezzemoulense]
MSNDERDIDDAETKTKHPHFWTDGRGRTFVGEGGGEIVRLNRLTAVAEYGIDAVETKEVHHALYASDPDSDGDIRVNAPDFLFPLERSEHRKLHHDGDWQEVDGIPLLLPPSEGDSNQADVADSAGESTSVAM